MFLNALVSAELRRRLVSPLAVELPFWSSSDFLNNNSFAGKTACDIERSDCPECLLAGQTGKSLFEPVLRSQPSTVDPGPLPLSLEAPSFGTHPMIFYNDFFQK